MTELFLASGSPRRSQLLTEAGIPFVLFVVPVEEEALAEAYPGPIEQLGEYLARVKVAMAHATLAHEGRSGDVLAADTTVLLDSASLAKPRDAEEATWMLRRLRGRTHTVATGVAVATPSGEIRSATSDTLVTMRDYSDDEIARYVATGDPLDKAGAYSIQHPGFSPVATIEGCRLGVVGLPVCLAIALLGLDAPFPAGSICPWSRACTPPFPEPPHGHA
ncbi:MAG TPA: Maf family protein [Ktedonobacterales bacterium]